MKVPFKIYMMLGGTKENQGCRFFYCSIHGIPVNIAIARDSNVRDILRNYICLPKECLRHGPWLQSFITVYRYRLSKWPTKVSPKKLKEFEQLLVMAGL